LSETICLSRIVTDGLQAVNPMLKRMDHASFRDKPDWANLLSTGKIHCLYIPLTFNFRAVDGTILLLDHAKKTAHLYLIQITLSMRHKESEKDFYSMIWPSWIPPLVDVGFSVGSTFVWIDKKQPTTGSEPQVTRGTRSGTKIVSPEYKSIHIGIDQVDRPLAVKLGLIPFSS
jgi:hypothetical protein